MKKIKSIQDISLIINKKCDIKDDLGKVVPYHMFLSMKLIDILVMISNGEWTYNCES